MQIVAVIGRILGWGSLGGACGLVLGVIVGLLHIPPDRPDDPLANEWYVVGVIFTLFFELVGGGIVGGGIAACVPGLSARKRVFVIAIGGAVLGVVAVRLLPDQGDDALMLSLLAQSIGVVTSLSLGLLWWAVRAYGDKNGKRCEAPHAKSSNEVEY